MMAKLNEKIEMFRNRLSKVFRNISRQAKRRGISCYRLYDHDLPEFPFCIEKYGNKVYVAEYKRQHGLTEQEWQQWLEESLHVIADVLSVNREDVFLRLRQRKQGRPGQYQKLKEEHHEFEVEENGLKFIVNLSDFLDTGLFLDHRITRQFVQEQSKGKQVLNLFAYTGSFSVYAAAGGAAEVSTVDLSNTYLQWARRNMQLNGFMDETKYLFVQADVKQYLKMLPASSYDLIVMDPPTFSNSQRMKDFLDIQQDHASLINDCMAALKPGGILYFSTNYRKFKLEKDTIKASSIKEISRAITPFDFEGKTSLSCFCMTR